ncbi:SRPBCC family protein [Luteipulveratus halotolerans]|uniref:Polyketide cyclase n=1 Tax=Luteipulveratus halotolerans TaxID=1631356 RepID=A0A0L6CLM9_9MICO|nr:SRPBCC family protein [Luteipulveratus halotolerans]KNX38696.1 polyketide cyclase [Luteipulveratus halotolerans]
MSTTTRKMACSPDDVFSVLADGWSFAQWVVGAARVRAVDHGWPGEGRRIHHSVGAWPALVSDTTSVEEVEPGRRLVLTARGWPMGQARVEITCERDGVGSRVTLHEQVNGGPPLLVLRPVRDAALGWRNIESLRRLAYLAEGRARSEDRLPARDAHDRA